MSKQKTISNATIKKLVIAYKELKQAENNFKALKEKYAKDLDVGSYEGQDGKVTVSKFERSVIDYKGFFSKHPRLLAKLKEYTNVSQTRAVNVNPNNNQPKENN